MTYLIYWAVTDEIMALSRPALDNLKASYKKNAGLLLPDIKRHVMRKTTDDANRDTHHVHPSDMAKKDWCQRHTYYRVIDTPVETKPKSPSFPMANAFLTGNFIHRKYQNWMAEMGILWGLWECLHCGANRFGATHAHCPACHVGIESYREVPFEDEKHLTWGHADGLVEIDGGTRMVLIEIKSIGLGTLRFEAMDLHDALQNKLKTPDEVWNSINHPFPSHLIQGQIYLRLMEECYPDIMVDTIVFIYEWKATGEIKEFVVRRNKEFSESYFERALQVAVAVETGGEIMPEYPSWADIDAGFCQACDYYQSCYSIEAKTDDEPAPRRPVRIQKTTSAKRRRAIG